MLGCSERGEGRAAPPCRGSTQLRCRPSCHPTALPPPAGIVRLVPVPIPDQARALAALGEHQAALELCATLPVLEEVPEAPSPPPPSAPLPRLPSAELPEPGSARGGLSRQSSSGSLSAALLGAAEEQLGAVSRAAKQQLEDELRLHYGLGLLQEGDYEGALVQISMCSQPDPRLLLRLFPSLLPAAFLKHLPDSAYGSPLPALPEPTGQRLQEAVAVLLPYLLSHRSRVLGALAAEQQQGQGQQEGQGQQGGSGERRSSGASAGAPGPQLLARLVDTALVRAMLLQPDSGALLRFLQQPNHVDLGEGSLALRALGRYAELAALLQQHRQHREAMALLRSLSQAPGELPVPPTGAAKDLPGLPGVWAAIRCGLASPCVQLAAPAAGPPASTCLPTGPAAVARPAPDVSSCCCFLHHCHHGHHHHQRRRRRRRYLVSMQPLAVEVVQEHMPWVLARDGEAGVEALLQLGPALSPSAALALLQQHAPGLCAAYLELALKLGVAAPEQFHNELLLIYLHEALLEDQQARQQEQQQQQAEQADGAVPEPGTPPAHEGSGSGTPTSPSPGPPVSGSPAQGPPRLPATRQHQHEPKAPAHRALHRLQLCSPSCGALPNSCC
jgi:hypothetical protein